MSNIARATQVLGALAGRGVATICCCPGGRNAPLVAALTATTGLERLDFYDERAAAFFALGRARSTARPVAVLTTSGTAVAELLPATIEARHAAVPLVLVTADRPPAYRGTGAPQSIVQPGLFGAYAPTVFDGSDASEPLDLSTWDGSGPVHVNVCFDEPLIDRDPVTRDFQPAFPPPPSAARAGRGGEVLTFLERASAPVVLLGPLQPADHDGVRQFLERLGAPIHADPSSGLREDAALQPLMITAADGGIRHAATDAVLRIGGVPTVRFWRDLARADIPVLSISPAPLAGLPRGALLTDAPGAILAPLEPAARPVPDHLAADRGRRAAIDALLDEEPASEPAMIRALSRQVPADALVYLGNSLPIREWDLAAVRSPRTGRSDASRGANGIDGQLATFLGMCGGPQEHWAVLGDLTTLYDLGAPWILPQLASVGPIRIVVVNNGGGQIFARLFDEPAFRNEHAIGFEHWARMWGMHYQRWDATMASAPAAPAVLELRPDRAASARFWSRYDGLT